ncbi:MAG: hypothetical protein K8T25_01845 [Planctomycetia bacterium]|nr:hypothetical protein [Planctomycetia bacterium]
MRTNLARCILATTLCAGLAGCQSGFRWDWWHSSKNPNGPANPVASAPTYQPVPPSTLVQPGNASPYPTTASAVASTGNPYGVPAGSAAGSSIGRGNYTAAGSYPTAPYPTTSYPSAGAAQAVPYGAAPQTASLGGTGTPAAAAGYGATTPNYNTPPYGAPSYGTTSYGTPAYSSPNGSPAASMAGAPAVSYPRTSSPGGVAPSTQYPNTAAGGSYTGLAATPGTTGAPYGAPAGAARPGAVAPQTGQYSSTYTDTAARPAATDYNAAARDRYATGTAGSDSLGAAPADTRYGAAPVSADQTAASGLPVIQRGIPSPGTDRYGNVTGAGQDPYAARNAAGPVNTADSRNAAVSNVPRYDMGAPAAPVGAAARPNDRYLPGATSNSQANPPWQPGVSGYNPPGVAPYQYPGQQPAGAPAGGDTEYHPGSTRSYSSPTGTPSTTDGATSEPTRKSGPAMGMTPTA